MQLEINEIIKQKRKMLLLLPLLVLPFVTLAFWVLGGGKKKNDVAIQEGINGQLPGARLPDDKDMDKMAFYDKAEQGSQNRSKLTDSANSNQGIVSRNDSSLAQSSSVSGFTTSPYGYGLNQSEYPAYGNYSGNGTENKIRSRLQDIQQQLQNSENGGANNIGEDVSSSSSYRLDKLNGMLQTEGQVEKDPEMEQLQEMMKHIYDIQHPEVVKAELRKQSELHQGIIYPVAVSPEVVPVTLLTQLGTDSVRRLKNTGTEGFFGLDDYSLFKEVDDAGISATIQDNITVVEGATVKMRLSQDIYVNGAFIPKGAFITGTASMQNDRVLIEIHSLLHNAKLYSVKLSAYDMDGIEGIYVPGSINRDVARQSGDDAVQSIGIGSLDPSIGAQATAAGIETAKTLLSKKMKLVKVFIKAGHKLVLKDNNKQ